MEVLAWSKDFKRGCKALTTKDLIISEVQRKRLRKLLDPQERKVVSRANFLQFMNEHSCSSEVLMAILPKDLPKIPHNFRNRPNVEKELVELLLRA